MLDPLCNLELCPQPWLYIEFLEFQGQISQLLLFKHGWTDRYETKGIVHTYANVLYLLCFILIIIVLNISSIREIRRRNFYHYNDVMISAMASQNHQPRGCLLNRLFGRRSKKTSKLRLTGLCAGNSPVTGERASNVEIFPFDDVIMSIYLTLASLFQRQSYDCTRAQSVHVKYMVIPALQSVPNNIQKQKTWSLCIISVIYYRQTGESVIPTHLLELLMTLQCYLYMIIAQHSFYGDKGMRQE